MIKEIKNPKDKIIKIATTSVLIGREEYDKESDEFRAVSLMFFNVNNPHKKKNVFPTQTLRFSNIEKVRIRRLNVSYYMEGPHIVINDLEELYIIHEDNKLVLKGYQLEVEHRVCEPEDKAEGKGK